MTIGSNFAQFDTFAIPRMINARYFHEPPNYAELIARIEAIEKVCEQQTRVIDKLIGDVSTMSSEVRIANHTLDESKRSLVLYNLPECSQAQDMHVVVCLLRHMNVPCIPVTAYRIGSKTGSARPLKIVMPVKHLADMVDRCRSKVATFQAPRKLFLMRFMGVDERRAFIDDYKARKARRAEAAGIAETAPNKASSSSNTFNY
ncbi:unnamed protein product [Caenorhabditis bovis]|uniref:Uncharacterized protein n=1 Tax=Caenorhabditis bovis TaxID=2654633 RepID=A0A8S1F457_9PELO|nr:unnamed protein product [Caenorhabditis bovis]